MFQTTRRKALQALGIGGVSAVAGCAGAPRADDEESEPAATDSSTVTAAAETADSVAADPTDVPAPIDRDSPKHHDIELTAREVVAEIEPGKTFTFLTYDGQIPGPMIRVRQGDTVSFTMKNAEGNVMPHNVDMHAIYGTGGGAVATTAAPGKQNGHEFTAEYPGAYIYHCAVPRLDYHIASGMFGMILVEPKAGLPAVDRELYFGQHEVYTAESDGSGPLQFDQQAMVDETPTYVLFNGEKYAWSADRHGPVEVDKGDVVRVYLVCGGPNLSSNFHPIGNVWSRAWRDGALAGDPELNVQTMKVPPGSCMVGDMETPVPERIKLVDHALSRVRHKGALAEVDVVGEEAPETFDPSPDTAASEDEEGPLY
jgi:nitrite reductase (NO-forming)